MEDPKMTCFQCGIEGVTSFCEHCVQVYRDELSKKMNIESTCFEFHNIEHNIKICFDDLLPKEEKKLENSIIKEKEGTIKKIRKIFHDIGNLF